MLVLKRRPGQSLVIGEDIEIQILELTTTRVKLGISAPDSISVVRKEVVLTRQQNLSASQPISHGVLDWLTRGIWSGLAHLSDGQNLDGSTGDTSEVDIQKSLRKCSETPRIPQGKLRSDL